MNLRVTCPFVNLVTWQIKSRYISTSTRTSQLNLKQWCLMKRGHHPQWSHYKLVARRIKKVISLYMAHDFQTRQSDGLWYWAITRKVPWFFYHVIICSLMTNQNRYIFSSASPMDTKFDVHRAHGIEDIKFFILSCRLHFKKCFSRCQA